MQCLRDGANALEPDVCHDAEFDTPFHVREQRPGGVQLTEPKAVVGPTLQRYLQQLRTFLVEHPQHDLAMILFDLKAPYDYSIVELFKIIRTEFSQHFPKTSILATTSSQAGVPFLRKLPARPNEAIGIDESLTPAEVAAAFKGRPYSFATGISVPGVSRLGFLPGIDDAVAIRDGAGSNCRLVYAWTVNVLTEMRNFIEHHVDGMITDDVPRLKAIVTSEFADRIRLATSADTPFANPPHATPAPLAT
jgi:hypothetical protein